jgi:uncharacterized protein (DUF2147 family)
MKQIKILIVLMFMFGITQAQNPDAIIGKYHLPNDLDVEIFKVGNEYQGRIIGLNNYENGQTIDLNNPDESLRNTPLIGMVIIKGLRYDPDENEWIDGEMYGPEKGMVFNLKVTEIRAKEIEVVGSKFFIWRTLQWQKIGS